MLLLHFVFGCAIILHSSTVSGQREWVQWGPLRVYVVGRGRNGNLQNLQQLRDDREVNSVQDILAQLDTAQIENATLPLISIALPRINESITLDCITASNEPGQCKKVKDCFFNAFTREGRIKNRALLEADVESSVSCNQSLPHWGQNLNLGYDPAPAKEKYYDIRDKLICCEKPKILDFMKIVNITQVKPQEVIDNVTKMLEMESAMPTSMSDIVYDTTPSAMDMSEYMMNFTDAETLPNFEALIAPLMPEIMKLQKNSTVLMKLVESETEAPTIMPDIDMVTEMDMDTTPMPQTSSMSLPLMMMAQHEEEEIEIQDKGAYIKNSSKLMIEEIHKKNGQLKKAHPAALSSVIKKHAPNTKLCIIKPHLQCAAKRVGNYRAPENINLKNKYAWMATLFVDRQMFCMGSLIDADHILTAAHCFPKNPNSMDFEKVRVGIGYSSDKPNITAPFVNRRVAKIVVHEGFNFKTLINDIAIVKLESPAFNKTSLFDYDDVIDQDANTLQPKPICFTEATEDINTSFENQEAILSGWTIPRRRRKTMAQEITIRVWNNEECCAKYGDIPPAGITEEMMCAFTYGKNDCFSRYNTGAPLFIISEKGKRVNAYNHSTPSYIVDRYNGDDEGEYVQFQIGILSWGYGCKDYPPVFTRVNPYFDWIEKNLI